jgi:hypothetical protein
MKIVRQLFADRQTSLLTLFFMLFSFGQLQRVQLTKEVAFYGHDLVLLAFLIWDLITEQKIIDLVKKTFKTIKKFTVKYRLEIVWLGWILGGMIIGGLAGRLGFKALLYLARIIAYLLFIWLIKQKKNPSYAPKKGFLLAGTLIGGWGILQYLLLPDTRFLHIFGWDNHYYRLISTLLDPAFTGMILVLTFGLWQSGEFSKTFSKFKLLIQVLLSVGVAATFSRASYLALFILLILLLLTQRIHLKRALLIGLIFIAAVLTLPKPGGEGVNLTRTSTTEARSKNAQQNLVYLKGAQWLWGRGLFNSDNTADYQTSSHAAFPDSLPVLLLNATGVGGSLLTLMVAKKWLINWWKKDSLWASLLLVVLIHSLFNNTLLQPFVFLFIWGVKKD